MVRVRLSENKRTVGECFFNESGELDGCKRCGGSRLFITSLC